MGWAVTEHGRNSHAISFPLSASIDQWLLFLSDIHIDATGCVRDKLTRHLDEGLEKNAIVVIGGDLFDAMQGKHDKRANIQNLRAEYAGRWGDYFDLIVDDAVEFFEPYKDMIALCCRGNHETGVSRNSRYNLTQAFVDKIRVAGGRRAHMGGYGGYVNFRGTMSSSNTHSRVMYYHHGHGGSGGGPSKGIAICSRMAERHIADLYWTGHIHTDWTHRHSKQWLELRSMSIRKGDVRFICSPGYNDGWGDGADGYEVEKNHGPKPTGGHWLRFYRGRGKNPEMLSEVTSAE